MANYCVLCGEEIPEDRTLCGVCTTIAEAMPPDKAKKLQEVIENEKARAELGAALREIRLQMKIALAPVIECICDFIARVCGAVEE